MSHRTAAPEVFRLVLLLALSLLLLAGCGELPTPADSIAGSDTTPQAPSTTPSSTATPSPTPTHTPTHTPTPIPTSTPTPTATPTPTPLPGASLVAFETSRDGNAEIYLLDTAAGTLINLTRHPADDRAPAWHPDGNAIAFESHRDGNWDLYRLDLATGDIARMTEHPAYDGAPAWSPDGAEIAFESYRDGNLEIYAMAATGGAPRRLTDDPAGDYGPAWHPGGSTIAFTSWRDGDKEIYLVPAAGGEAENLTQHPADDEAPAWAPDGGLLAFVSWRDEDPDSGNRNAEIYLLDADRAAPAPAERLTDNAWPDLDPAWDSEGQLVWSSYEPGPPFEAYDPYRPGDYHLYRHATGDGGDEVAVLTGADWDDRRPAPAPAYVPPLDGLAARLPALPPTATPQPTLVPGTLAQVVQVPGVLASYSGEPVRVSERVAASLVAWQRDLIEASGHDFLANTLGAWRGIEQVRKREMYAYDYGYLSWHKAGRALDLPLEFKVDGRDQLIQVREDQGPVTYWRLYLRAARQDGSQGEPLKQAPWLYWWHIVPEAEPDAYDAGGKRLPIPAGYYVDVTALAKRHGWERIAAYAIEGDYHWSVDSNGTEYWHYERTDGLTWWEAMQQLYDPETLATYVGWEASMEHAQTEEMVRTKGIPTPAP